MTTFEGRPWRLVGWMDTDGAAHPVPAGVEATAAFADGFVTGRGGCNGFRGPYLYDGSRLEVGPLAATLMACDEPAMRVEAGFHDGLRRARAARASESSLALLDDAGRVVLELVPAAVTPLVGTAWSATGINNGRGGVVSVIEGTAVRVVFAEDGRAAGSAGCNGFTAGYRLDGEGIVVEGIVATMRACLGPDGVMQQEAAFFAALARVRRWAVDGPRLALRDDAGALQVAFEATPG